MTLAATLQRGREAFDQLADAQIVRSKIMAPVGDAVRLVDGHEGDVAPRQKGHEGYLVVICDLHATNTAHLLLFAAGEIEKGPIARLHIPMRQRCGVHGMWAPIEALGK